MFRISPDCRLRIYEKVVPSGTIFRFCTIRFYPSRPWRWLPFLLLAGGATLADCPADHTDEQATVRHVHDGDTVILTDGRHLRMLGIDTPELGRQGRPAEPFANKARDRLRQLLGDHPKVRLRYDEQRIDHYGRTLAYIFLNDGSNVARDLLLEGLATTLIMPPNRWAADCYHAAQRTARLRRVGIWQLPSMQAQPLEALSVTSAPRLMLLQGTVRNIYRTPKVSRIHLRDGVNSLYLHIKAAERPLFDAQLKRLQEGTRVEAQGRVYSNGNYRFMRLRDPGSLQLLPR